MWIIKASFKSETRRFNLEQTDVPTYEQLTALAQRVFPAASFHIANLRFSSKTGAEKILAQRVSSPQDYLDATANLCNQPWYYAKLRFDVVDDASARSSVYASSRASIQQAPETHVPPVSSSTPSAPGVPRKGEASKTALQGILSKFLVDFETIVSSTFGEEEGHIHEQEPTKVISKSDSLHRGIYCDHCGSDIRGVRYKCESCYASHPTRGYDLCSECVANRGAKGIHTALAGSSHAFKEIAEPNGGPSKPADQKLTHFGVLCDKCDVQIVGDRHKCLDCRNFDLCGSCIEGSETSHPHRFVKIKDPSTASKVISDAHSSTRPRHEASCNACNEQIVGNRHKCLDCVDYDLCEECFEQASIIHPLHEFFKLTEPGRLVVHTIAEEPTHSQYHKATCDLCESRIRGYRFKCIDCPDYDVCERCMAITPEQHPNHVFVKVRHPQDIMSRSAVHDMPTHNAYCNVCSRTIIGVRYKCMAPGCPDFDLCMNCEALPIPVHPETHPLWKIKSPVITLTSPLAKKAPHEAGNETIIAVPLVRSDDCNETSDKSGDHAKSLSDNYDHASSAGTVKQEDTSEEEQLSQEGPRMQATFISDNNIPDGAIIAPGAEFVKSWQMLNSGRTAWSERTSIAFTGGHRLAAFNLAPASFNVGSTEPGSVVNVWAAEMKAPDEPGRYVSRWRLQDENGDFFGDEVWCDIIVPEFDTGNLSHSGSVTLPTSLNEDGASQNEHITEAAPTSSSSLPTNLVSESDASIIQSVQGQVTLSDGISAEWEDAGAIEAEELAKGLDYLIVYDSEEEEREGKHTT